MACERGPVDVAAPAGTAEVTARALITPTVDTRASNLVAARSSLTTVSSRYAKLPGTVMLVPTGTGVPTCFVGTAIGHLLWPRNRPPTWPNGVTSPPG